MTATGVPDAARRIHGWAAVTGREESPLPEKLLNPLRKRLREAPRAAASFAIHMSKRPSPSGISDVHEGRGMRVMGAGKPPPRPSCSAGAVPPASLPQADEPHARLGDRQRDKANRT